MKRGLLVIVGLLYFCCMYSQQKAPPTEEELQAMIKKIQRQSDSIQNVLKNKRPPDDANKNVTITSAAKVAKRGGKLDLEKKLPPKDSERIKNVKLFPQN